jgi:hypothetical protein
MATFEQVKAIILDVAGNPETGAIADLADQWAAAIVSIDEPIPYKIDARDGDGDGMVQDGTKFERPAKKETRVTKPTELR